MNNKISRFNIAEFHNQYRYEENVLPLGEGAFGTVYRCYDKVTSVERAVKAIDKEQAVAARNDSLQWIMKEISSMQRVSSHECIVNYVEHFSNEIGLLIVMEFVEGVPLTKIIEDNEFFFTETHAKTILYYLASAVDHLHRHDQLMHRDIKPDNIIIDDPPSGIKVKLLDFGIAKHICADEIDTHHTINAGTPGYRAPEVSDTNGHYDFSADCWSVGVILYQMLIFEMPESVGCGLAELAQTRGQKRFPPESDYALGRWRKTSDTGKQLVKALLDVDPRSRMTMEELLLHPWLADRNLSIRLPYNIQSSEHAVRKNVGKFQRKTLETGAFTSFLQTPRNTWTKYFFEEVSLGCIFAHNLDMFQIFSAESTVALRSSRKATTG